MSLSIRLLCEPVRSIAAAAISNAYMGVGTAMSQPIRMFIFQNLTDAEVMVSFDGINDNLPLASNGYLVLDVTANKTINTGFFFAEGSRIYVKQIGVPTTGNVYVTTFYGSPV